MDRQTFRRKFAQAQNQFVQETRDGCNECTETDLCGEHYRIAEIVVLDPRRCEPFQEFLRTMGLIK